MRQQHLWHAIATISNVILNSFFIQTKKIKLKIVKKNVEIVNV